MGGVTGVLDEEEEESESEEEVEDEEEEEFESLEDVLEFEGVCKRRAKAGMGAGI